MTDGGWSTADRRWMRRALRLAVRSLGRTAPNPGVGCIIVRDGQEIARGRHERCGGPHAEVAALDPLAAAGHGGRAAGATAYISLAPCTRHGRTPPCVDALIAAGLRRVVAALADPWQDDPSAAFEAAGVRYEVGCEEALAAEVHGGFVHRQRYGRPRVTGKWAATLDGHLHATGGHSAWISDQLALALSRRRRRVYDAIAVGADTARADDPRLAPASGVEHDRRGPLRVVFSSRAALPLDSRLARSARDQPVLVIHDQRAPEASLVALAELGVRCASVADAHDPRQLLDRLAVEGCNEVLVEGGARIHGAFLAADCYDRIECYWGALTLGGGGPIALGTGPQRIDDGARWSPEAAPRLLGSTVWMRYRRLRLEST